MPCLKWNGAPIIMLFLCCLRSSIPRKILGCMRKSDCTLMELRVKGFRMYKTRSINRITNNNRSIEEESKKQEKSRSILELPCDIHIEILSRLPVKTIFQCRCVCKRWCKLLLHPRFAKVHFQRSPASLVLLSCKSRGKGKPNDIYLVNYEASDHTARVKLNSNLSLLWRYEVEISCNGMMCLCDRYSGFPLYILNPITGDYITIPQAGRKYYDGSLCRFGYCLQTSEYKVLQFCRENLFVRYEAMIYTLGTDSWRSSGCVPNPPSGCFYDYDSFLNGCYHWLGSKGEFSEVICSFDFTNETFQLVPPPLQFDTHYKREQMNIGVFDECLCILVRPLVSQYDIWIMKKYGVQESWTKQFVIGPTELGWFDNIRPIKLLGDGEILLLHENRRYNRKCNLASYCFRRKCIEVFKIRGTGSEYSACFSLVPSFVSFRDIVKAENLEVYNIKECKSSIFTM